MRVIDLNADVGEGDVLSPGDLALLDTVTSASLACGFHAGNPSVMRETTRACLERGVTLGAHVSFRDRAGFGRRALDVDPARLVADIMEQWAQLSEAADAEGGAVSFVKPHGALYNQMGRDPAVADAVVEALVRTATGILVAQAGTVAASAAQRAGLRVVGEGFPDRGYLADGRLAARDEVGALIEDPADAGRRAVSMVRRGGVEALDGTWAAVAAETLCIHGDSPGADHTARSVRAALEADGVAVRPFVRADRAPDRGSDRDPGSP